MRRSTATLALLVLAAVAQAKPSAGATGIVVRFPSADVDTAALLQQAMSNPAVSAIVFEKGTYQLSSTLFVFRRSDLTLCSASGAASDVTLESSATVALQLEQTVGTTVRGMTIRTTAAGGTAVKINSVVSTEVESFADETTLADCAFEGFIAVQAAVRAKHLTLTGCRCTVTQAGGAGLLWEDGEGLFVARNRFTSQSGTATAAIFVRGAQTASSQGERARHLILARNTVRGDFATGFDLADVEDVEVRQNQIRFPGPEFQSGANLQGRVGIVVRRAAASALTEDYRLARNSVRKAHYGIWLLNSGRGEVVANELHGCGAPVADTRFLDRGGAIRLNLQSAVCNISIQRNDLRGLNSPPEDPAVVVQPVGSEAACFSVDDHNLKDRGRALFLGAATQ